MVVGLMDTTISLSIFLLRLGKEKDFERDAGDDPTARSALAPPLEGYFSPLPSMPKMPSWVPAVQGLVASPSSVVLEAQSPAALLLVRRGARTFVITFGHAWLRLKSDWLERDFGRRAALNLIKANSLIELRTEQVFAQWHVASERAPRGSAVDTFGVEFDRDLVSTVEGISSEPMFGKVIRGGPSLRVHADLTQLGALLDRAVIKFRSKAYLKQWPDIDNLSFVSDAAIIATLEKNLDADLASGKASKSIVLFTPAQRRGEPLTAASYVVGRFHKNAALTPYLTFGSWENHAKKHGLPLTTSTAKATPIHLLDDSSQELDECSAFDCFGYEASLAGKPYILSSGIWYDVVPSFLNRINRTAGQIPVPQKPLPAWNGIDDEGVYNAGCAKSDNSLLLFDKKIVWYGGGQSRFEFCDLMHLQSRRLYFVKVPTRSSGLSHLIEQARRTTELFFSSDAGFRQALKQKILRLDPNADTSWTSTRPRPGDWKLCLVSMGRQAQKLPFFARCSLANAYRDFRAAGHEVEYQTV